MLLMVVMNPRIQNLSRIGAAPWTVRLTAIVTGSNRTPIWVPEQSGNRSGLRTLITGSLITTRARRMRARGLPETT